MKANTKSHSQSFLKIPSSLFQTLDVSSSVYPSKYSQAYSSFLKPSLSMHAGDPSLWATRLWSQTKLYPPTTTHSPNFMARFNQSTDNVRKLAS